MTTSQRKKFPTSASYPFRRALDEAPPQQEEQPICRRVDFLDTVSNSGIHATAKRERARAAAATADATRGNNRGGASTSADSSSSATRRTTARRTTRTRRHVTFNFD